jgi:cell wall-active antibiotic response 4TMS protein YvqF
MAHPYTPTPTPASPRFVRDYGRILLGLIVVALGLLFLLDNAGSLDAGRAIDHWWPTVLIGMGGFQLAERTHGTIGPLVFIVAGGVLLLFTTNAVEGNAWDYVWPTAIIAAGLLIISRWRGAMAVRGDGGGSDDVVVASGIFGGPNIVSASQSFRGASLTAVFGGVSLDLRQARLAPQGAAITATAVFGGMDILVPRGWRVAINATPFFGGVDDKTDHSAAPPEEAPVLKIDALTVFGGVDVKHEKK